MTPINPMNLINPMNPIEPINPFNPMNPINPMNPMNLINPINPMNPMNPYREIEIYIGGCVAYLKPNVFGNVHSSWPALARTTNRPPLILSCRGA